MFSLASTPISVMPLPLPYTSRLEESLRELEEFNARPFPFAIEEDLGIWDPVRRVVVFGRQHTWRAATDPPASAPTEAPAPRNAPRRLAMEAPTPATGPTPTNAPEQGSAEEFEDHCLNNVYLKTRDKTRRLSKLPDPVREAFEERIRSYFCDNAAVARIWRFFGDPEKNFACLYTSCVSRKAKKEVKKEVKNTACPRCAKIGELCMRKRGGGGLYILPREQEEDEDYSWKEIGFWTDEDKFDKE
ncbi:hypothetical protein IWX46DRAFT_645427 [Phyllosticta citricarpa]|uniref:Uncharacterized protein n=1 Tax=Phyllosticta citricarpa TaxID=55181 RepID=A0ABR1L5S9_9PEZI